MKGNDMTFDEFVDNIRQEIREEGYMAATKLAARIVVRAEERDLKGLDYERVLTELPCQDIHVLEYANSITVEYRRKDLYYFNPDVQGS